MDTKKNKMKPFDVYHLGKWIDTVYFHSDFSEGEVKESLVKVDKYPEDIRVIDLDMNH